VHLTHRQATRSGRLMVGLAAGVGGGLVMAAPLLIYDW